MTVTAQILCLAAFLACIALTGVVLRHARRVGLLDHPNARSSHSIPTPRGGGLAFVVVMLAGMLVAAALGLVPWLIAGALIVPGAAVALIGWVDDHQGVPPLQRLAVHLAACAATLALIAYSLDNQGAADPRWTVPIVLMTWIACGWFLNLFNFMDGIDGIAASEAAFLGCAAWILLAGQADAMSVRVLFAVLCSTVLGFLLWNWAPARIFMGDVGSGFLGFILAMLLVAADLSDANFSAWTSLALVGPFAADATVTMLRRMWRRERWYSAHRCHAYQQLARRWKSHARVTIVLTAVNLTMALPVAWATMRKPEMAAIIGCGGFGIFCVLLFAIGAGRNEPVAGSVGV